VIVGDSGAAVYSIVVEDFVLNLEAIDDAGRCFFLKTDADYTDYTDYT
jgi:hypothetical protein